MGRLGISIVTFTLKTNSGSRTRLPTQCKTVRPSSGSFVLFARMGQHVGLLPEGSSNIAEMVRQGGCSAWPLM